MAENTVNLTKNIIPQSFGDILLIDHDTISVASLIPMLKQRSHKDVMNVNGASEAISVIENQKNLGLVIANVELSHSNDFLTAIHHKEIHLILIGTEIKIEEASDLLTKRACYCLKKPISENDMDNMLQHVVGNKRQECRKINIVEEAMKQMEGFRENIKRQATSQSSLLRRRPLTSSEMYLKGKSIANVERRKNVWTRDRHMKFLAAISILGEKESRPKAILEIMNDSNLSRRQVASHLQKYKFQVERISNTLTRTDKTFEYPSSNCMWYSSASTVQYSFKRSAAERKEKMPKFHLGERSGVHHHSLSGLSVGASNLDAFQIGRVSLGENHGLSQDMIFNGTKSNHLGLVTGETSHFETALETDTNQMDWDCFFSDETYAILEDMTVSETNRTQVGLVPVETSSASLENVAPPENNTKEIGLVPYQIEDLISFDTDNNEMDLDAWLENFDSSRRDVPLPAIYIGHDHSLAMHLDSTSQHQNIQAAYPREAIEGGIHLNDDSDQHLDWIDDILV